MYGFFVFIHVMVCIALIMIVLFQSGKGAGLGNVFGGGGSDQLFSAPSGSAFIKKLTTTVAIVFVFSSLFLAILSSRRGQRSLMERVPMPSAPATPRPAVP